MSEPLQPIATIRSITGYVARWPFRHINGALWLSNNFRDVIGRVGTQSISCVYGLEFRDHVRPPKVRDLALVSIMQGVILLAFIGLAIWAWNATGDYILPGFLLLSVFHVIPSPQDFLTSGSLEKRVPPWLKPITSALSFFVSMPAMIIAIPAAVVWGLIGTIKNVPNKSEGR